MTLGELKDEKATQNKERSVTHQRNITPQNISVPGGKINGNTINEKQNDGTISFLRAARGGDLDKLLSFLKSGEISDINCCNANGLNALHLAAKDGYVDICCELLAKGINVDNATKKGNTALHIASLAGQLEVIEQLILNNANVNVQSSNGFTPLYMAAQENHEVCCRMLLAHGANSSLATEDGFTPLAVAMQQGHEKVVTVLLENDARGKVRLPALHIAAKKNDVNAATLLLKNDHNADIVSKSGFTPLHIAAHYGNVDIAKLLLDWNANVNFVAKHNITPLHVASKWGKSEICSLLLSRGACIHAATRDGLTPLHCASRSGHMHVIRLLLQNNAPILTKTRNGLTALHMAAQGEHDEAARLLLDKEAPVDEVTIDYLTALHVAAHCGHVKVSKLLLDYGANSNSRALNGFTPLHIACKKNRIKVVEILIKQGANISATTESGLTPLHVASFMGCINIVIFLLKHNANPNKQTIRGESSLHLAARANQTDIIRILLRNGANVDIIAREGQTPLHVASRLGNMSIIKLLLQHGAIANAETKEKYTALHIAAKENRKDVAQILLEYGAFLDPVTNKGFTPLHLASKYGHKEFVSLLVKHGASIDFLGKNDVTPLLIATHYGHQHIVEQMLADGAYPNISARNGHCALHIAAKRNHLEIARHLLDNKADVGSISKNGYTPLHLAAQEGYIDMVKLLLQSGGKNTHSKNGLTPLHLSAQEGHTLVSQVLLDHGAEISERTNNGYTPLHIAAHYGHLSLVKLLIENDANIEISTNIGYTPLHQAAQQGHIMIINLLLRHKANPDALTHDGKSALNIANHFGFVTAVETLKVITHTSSLNTTAGVVEAKYKVMQPEVMNETLLSDSEDEAGDDLLDDNNYNYMANDHIKAIYSQDHQSFDTTIHESEPTQQSSERETQDKDSQPIHTSLMGLKIDNGLILRPPIHLGFLVSFLVDARGGSMRGYRHSGVRVIVPPKACAEPTRITCRYVKPQRVVNPPPLMEGEALVSRILELSPVERVFLSPITLEVPHFGNLRDNEREIIILRSDNGECWREHNLFESGEDINTSNNGTNKPITQINEFTSNRIVRIVTQNVPHFFAVVSRIRQDVHAIGPDGGNISSRAIPQVQALFPPHALTKKIRVGLQAQSVDLVGCSKLLGQGVAVSPVVTVEPRRRKFHKAITLSIPAPKASMKGMVNEYYGNGKANPSTLRLLCSITGGQTRAAWEDVTGSTPLSISQDSITFTTTVSARFWLMDCRNIVDAGRMATDLYTHLARVPFFVKFLVFGKRISDTEAKISIFCMTDDKEDKTLEQQEYFREMAKSRDIEILQDQTIYLEFSGNLVPVLKSDEQLNMRFQAFCENRLSFVVHIKDSEQPHGRISFMGEPKVPLGESPLNPLCVLNISIDMESMESIMQKDTFLSIDSGLKVKRGVKNCTELSKSAPHTVNTKTFVTKYDNSGFKKLSNHFENENVLKAADIKLFNFCTNLGSDWPQLANELGVPETDIDMVKADCCSDGNTLIIMAILKEWLQQADCFNLNKLTEILKKIGRADILKKCNYDLDFFSTILHKDVATLGSKECLNFESNEDQNDNGRVF
nr:ankyrin-3 isoform X2 [Drosophila bipectinata]XP_043069256.1 ankyrin-3 isoform X2 [Drosophila bipectinata]